MFVCDVHGVCVCVHGVCLCVWYVWCECVMFVCDVHSVWCVFVLCVCGVCLWCVFVVWCVWCVCVECVQGNSCAIACHIGCAFKVVPQYLSEESETRLFMGRSRVDGAWFPSQHIQLTARWWSQQDY